MGNDPSETWWIELEPRKDGSERVDGSAPRKDSSQRVVYQLARGSGAKRYTASNLEIDKRSVVQRLAVDLPGRGLVALRYQRRWKRLIKPVAKTGMNAASAAWGVAKTVARYRQPTAPPPPGHQWQQSAKEVMEKGSLALNVYMLEKHGRVVVEVWREPAEGYYDNEGKLAIEGTIRPDDLAPSWDVA